MKNTELISFLSTLKIFIIIDESYLNCEKYVNVLAGNIEKPEKTYFINYKLYNLQILKQL